ncbi:MAG: DUF1579 family protein [Anaerolineae bacterium]|jgi:hypothetical protein
MQTDDKAKQFDFWLGEWDLTWGENGRGRNVISKILDDRVIQEQFTSLPDDEEPPFVGLSLSVFNARTDQWHQTWVDNQGGYLDFTGGMVGDKMILSRQAVIEGQPVQQRMVWHNIQADTLDWSWERSDDDGQSWKVLWAIHYRRQSSG